jgi:hypothetical protein
VLHAASKALPGHLLLEGYSEPFRCPFYERYIRTEFSFFICLRAAGLAFTIAGAIIELITASAETGVKSSGHGGVDVTGEVTGAGSASA